MSSATLRSIAYIHRQYLRQLIRHDSIHQLLSNHQLDGGGEEGSPYIEWEVYRKQIEILLASVGVESLFEIAGSLNPAAHGPLGLAALSSETIGQASNIIAKHVQSRQTVVSITLEKTSSHHSLVFAANVTQDDSYHFLEIVIQLVISQILISMHRPPTKDSLVVYCRADDAYVRAALMQLGEFDCYFGSAQSKIVLAKEYLVCQSDYADRATCEANLLKCYKDKIFATQDHRKLIDKVNSLFDDYIAIRQLEYDGELPATVAPTAESIAVRLHMSPRTLHRKLQGEGSTYKNIWQVYKRNMAEQWLLETARPVMEIAELLGYQDTGNFIRAFKQWTDQTPTQWRDEHQ